MIGAAALAIAGAASAQTAERVSYSPEFAQALQEDLGQREGDYLSRELTRMVGDALARRGVSDRGLQIELSIIDARPNRPTFEQMSQIHGLDANESISVGGASLRAVLRDGSGAVVDTVEHRYYSHDIGQAALVAGQWSDAHRAMRRFADKVAASYVVHS